MFFYLYIPFGHVLVIEGHKDRIFRRVAHRVEFPQQELDELLSAFLGHNRESIDHNERIQTLFELHFILRLEIWMSDKEPR